MSVCLAWLGDPAQAHAVIASPGPWTEMIEVGSGLLVLETDETLSRVYHEIKWLLPEDCPLLVTPVAERPKARGLTEGAVSWLRARLPLADRG
jgi:hypothetical protein